MQVYPYNHLFSTLNGVLSTSHKIGNFPLWNQLCVRYIAKQGASNRDSEHHWSILGWPMAGYFLCIMCFWKTAQSLVREHVCSLLLTISQKLGPTKKLNHAVIYCSPCLATRSWDDNRDSNESSSKRQWSRGTVAHRRSPRELGKHEDLCSHPSICVKPKHYGE